MRRSRKIIQNKKRPVWSIEITIPAYKLNNKKKKEKQCRRTAPYYWPSNFHNENDEPLVERDFEG